MTRPVSLENFDGQPLAAAAPGPATTSSRPGKDAATAAPHLDLEEERLAAFEKGYKAGWDDAASAHSDEQQRISTEFAHNLQELGFTYQEAHAALVREAEEIFRGMVEKVLPETIAHTLSPLIVERAANAVAETGLVAEIVVAPENVERVRALCDGRVAPPLRVMPEATLSDGQAFLRFGTAEEKIDLRAVVDDIAGAVTQFLAAATGGPMSDGSPAPVEEKRYA